MNKTISFEFDYDDGVWSVIEKINTLLIAHNLQLIDISKENTGTCSFSLEQLYDNEE